MPKVWNDWSDLMKGEVGEPAHPLSRPIDARGPLNKMEKPPTPSNEEIAKAILDGAPAQPTDEQLFGHLVPSEEMVKTAENNYENFHNNFYNEVIKPVETQSPDKGWGSRGPIWKEIMTEEEKRISAIQVNESDSE